MKKPELRSKVIFTNPRKKQLWISLGMAVTLIAAILFYSFSNKKELNSAQQALTSSPTGESSLQNHSIQPSVTPSQSPASVQSSFTQYSPQTQQTIKTLDRILQSKNDNDPRLDSDFRHLSIETKGALRQKYSTLRKEDLNARGTIALLIGREISDSSDIQFLKEILNEEPCLSLENCTSEAHLLTGSDAHHEMGTEVTLAYPQLSALYWLEKFVSTPDASRSQTTALLLKEAKKAILAAQDSGSPLIRRKAEELEKKLNLQDSP